MSTERDRTTSLGGRVTDVGVLMSNSDYKAQPADRPEAQTRYFAVIRHKPAQAGDPIPWLATVYRGEAVEAYWRGTEAEAEAALDEYLDQRVSTDD